jgi:hypothetical protein
MFTTIDLSSNNTRLNTVSSPAELITVVSFLRALMGLSATTTINVL